MQLNNSEWEIMNILWNNSDLDLKEIRLAVSKAGIDWSPNTTQTLLVRLERKGAVSVQKGTNHFRYSANISRENCEKEAMNHLLAKVFRGSAKKLLMSFADSGNLSEEEIESIQKVIDKMH